MKPQTVGILIMALGVVSLASGIMLTLHNHGFVGLCLACPGLFIGCAGALLSLE